ncbi:MAG TPA: glucokinase [Terriglobales bacterium]|nr:glucokinase [Terriglobales bacterium]
MKMIVAADLGGTKCNIMLFEKDGGRLSAIHRRQVATAQFANIEAFLQDFISDVKREVRSFKPGDITSAGVGVAGAIVGDGVVCNNLPWTITRQRISEALGIAPQNTVLLNDVEAAASSLAYLEQKDMLPLNDAKPQAHAPKLYVAAGTGLGESILFWNGVRYQVSPCEAGLTDFAPRNESEIAILKFLQQHMRLVCTEELVSGRGFRAIHEALFPEVHHSFFNDPAADSAANITQQAFAKACSACERTLDLWTGIYGSEAGNMALRTLPFGGVYVGGGIALKILPKLKDGAFVRAFCDKTKLAEELARIPIYVVLNHDAPVLGAAYAVLAVSRASE